MNTTWEMFIILWLGYFSIGLTLAWIGRKMRRKSNANYEKWRQRWN